MNRREFVTGPSVDQQAITQYANEGPGDPRITNVSVDWDEFRSQVKANVDVEATFKDQRTTAAEPGTTSNVSWAVIYAIGSDGQQTVVDEKCILHGVGGTFDVGGDVDITEPTIFRIICGGMNRGQSCSSAQRNNTVRDERWFAVPHLPPREAMNVLSGLQFDPSVGVEAGDAVEGRVALRNMTQFEYVVNVDFYRNSSDPLQGDFLGRSRKVVDSYGSNIFRHTFTAEQGSDRICWRVSGGDVNVNVSEGEPFIDYS